MSYCVNCGVKLAASENKCPLCNTVVNNPNEPIAETPSYPHRLELFPVRSINWQYIVKLCLLILGATALITMLCDLLTTHQITWSVYVLIAAAYIGCTCSFLYFKSPYVSISIWSIGTVLLTGSIALLNDGLMWYSYLAAPFILFAGLYSIFCTWIIKSKGKSLLRKVAYCLLFCGVVLTGIECLSDLYLCGTVSLFWSIYAVFPITVIGIGLILLSFNRTLLDEIKRRTFM